MDVRNSGRDKAQLEVLVEMALKRAREARESRSEGVRRGIGVNDAFQLLDFAFGRARSRPLMEEVRGVGFDVLVGDVGEGEVGYDFHGDSNHWSIGIWKSADL